MANADSFAMDYPNFMNDTLFAPPNGDSCLVLNKKKIWIQSYEGIPETFLLNVIVWFVLMMVFTLVRQQAWDYGRLALVNSHGENKRWTQLFYAHGNVPGGGSGTTETSDGMNSLSIDRGFFSWIPATFRLTKEQILTHSGPDAVHYLSFQKHLMAVMGIMTVISIGVVLPINFAGTLNGDVNSFGHTTISNLDPNSPSMWAHVLFAIAYVPMVVLIMRRASGRNAFKTAPTRTLMATNISHGDCSKTVIRTYVQQLFPDVGIEDIQLAYNISSLIKAAEEYERIVEARIFCESHRTPIEMKPHIFSCDKADALQYYKDEEARLAGQVSRLRASALNDPLGIAFVTLSSAQEAQHVMLHFKPGTYREWNLSFAPAPLDIFWENLNIDTAQWYCKWFTVNFMLFLFLFFLTTPLIIVNQLDTFSFTKNTTSQISKISPLISEFLPTLLLWSLSALMPVIVAYSDTWLSHWTRSRQNYVIMTKTFGYLLFMILILPSLGLTSAQAFLQWTIQSNETYRWECIFLPDKGAFFVNYIITAAFIGTALELIRFPDLICYIWKLLTAKSKAETPYIRKSILISFPFGIHYAWMVMVFTMSTVYSLACPIIMPFAMIYLMLKHFVDKHNLFFAFAPSNMISQGSGGKVHSTAVTMTKFSVVLLLLIMAALATIRTGRVEMRGVVLIMALCLTLFLFAFMSPIKKCTTRPLRIVETDGPAPIYVADVLINRRMVSDSPSHLSYGSDTTMNIAMNDAGFSVTA